MMEWEEGKDGKEIMDAAGGGVRVLQVRTNLSLKAFFKTAYSV